MSSSDSSAKKNPPAIGFLTVIEHADHGLFGGYLVLNVNGRPLEFHCTAPVKANRAQEILYGASLKPFLYGEQIGQTLFSKGKVEPLLVCTDSEPILAVRDFIAPPVTLVQTAAAACEVNIKLRTFTIGKNRLAVSSERPVDEQKVIDAWQPHDGNLDLLEPFARIRDAIEEAQRSARPAA